MDARFRLLHGFKLLHDMQRMRVHARKGVPCPQLFRRLYPAADCRRTRGLSFPVASRRGPGKMVVVSNLLKSFG
jgi:hypothetical protein